MLLENKGEKNQDIEKFLSRFNDSQNKGTFMQEVS